MQKRTTEIHEFLETQGGMKITYPDKKEFIQAAIAVKDKFAAERGVDFVYFLKRIRETANNYLKNIFRRDALNTIPF